MEAFFTKTPSKTREPVLTEPVKAANADPAYTEKTEDGTVFVNALSPLFEISGIKHPDENFGEYYRLDASKKDTYSSNNSFLAACTAGAQVRFVTNADKITVRIKLRGAITGMHHFADRGVYGIDMYAGTGNSRSYLGAAMQTFAENPSGNEGTLALPAGVNEILINLPLYSGVSELWIGFDGDALLCPPAPRAVEKPVAFYGSSITQGGCVSRPGNMYSHILCRALDAPCLNLGFSGSAMGELYAAEYLCTREISAFVMDYDYNSPTAQTLLQTHEPFFKTFRKGHPEVPVIFVTHPYYADESDTDRERKAVVFRTYENALANGDKNVFYVDSESFFPREFRDLYSVDNLHPNDLGQYMMARAIFPALRGAFK